MIRHTIKNGGVLHCDMPTCSARYVTYSVVTKARERAAIQGWARINGKTVQDPDGHILSTKLVDLCPEHKPKTREMTMSQDTSK